MRKTLKLYCYTYYTNIYVYNNCNELWDRFDSREIYFLLIPYCLYFDILKKKHNIIHMFKNGSKHWRRTKTMHISENNVSVE